MQFFTSQKKAIKNTQLLRILFFITAFFTSSTLGITTWILFQSIEEIQKKIGSIEFHTLINDLPALYGLTVFLFSALLTFLGIIFRNYQLRNDGKEIALTLGGKQISKTSGNLLEKKILNFVDEISIARGYPSPSIYLLEDNSINAFSAGECPSNAAIGLTRGSIMKLKIDELEGVIAHEFSHITNKDTNVNFKLISWIYGISILTSIGSMFIQMAKRTYEHKPKTKKAAAVTSAALILAVIGITLWIIGIPGWLFAHLLQITVNKKNDFLADACSTEYIQNPNSICEALKKISDQSKTLHIKTMDIDMQHFNFSSRSPLFFFKTHSILKKRINRIQNLQSSNNQKKQNSSNSELKKYFSLDVSDTIFKNYSKINTLTSTQNIYELKGQIPSKILTLLQEPFGAQSVILALLLSKDKEKEEQQLHLITHNLNLSISKEVRNTLAKLHKTTRISKGIIIDLAAPAFSMLSNKQAKAFESTASIIMALDEKIDRFDWAIRTTIKCHIIKRFRSTLGRPDLTTDRIPTAQSTILAYLAQCNNTASWKDAYNYGVQFLSPAGKKLPPENVSIKKIDEALKNLEQSSLNIREALIHGCISVSSYNRKITRSDAEVLRGIATSLGLNLPRFESSLE